LAAAYATLGAQPTSPKQGGEQVSDDLVDVYARLAALHPKDLRWANQLFEAHLRRGEADRAEAVMAPRLGAMDPSQRASYGARIAQGYVAAGKKDQAARWVGQMTQGAKVAEPWQMAASVYEQMGDTEGAETALRKAIDLLPSAEQQESMRLALAQLYLRTGKRDQASAIWKALKEQATSEYVRQEAERLLASPPS
jgi:Flp pilus assembly protein TadD